MFLLCAFAFLGGLVTIASPCILPVLPLVLSAGATGSARRPYGIVVGFVLSFTFFTLFLSVIVNLLGVPADAIRNFAIFIIILFGLTLVVPKLNIAFERLTSGIAGRSTALKTTGGGFVSGMVFGLSLGLLWTPCVGPIIASVITLAQTGTVNGSAALVTFFYSLGTALPMFAIIKGGRAMLNKNQWLLNNLANIQKVFGVIAIVVAVAMFFGLDRKLQVAVLEVFPNYSSSITKLEEVADVSSLTGPKQIGDSITNKINNAVYPMAPEIVPGGEFINTPPITLQKDLKGKVVLLDFWTYTCINCIRTLPYIKDWYKKYKDAGFVVLGVHTPEFEFEKDLGNVKQAVKDFGILYPVVQDNEYATWRAFDNHYWPAHYLIDREGRVRHTHFGEGEYNTTEKVIQELLAEGGQKVNQKINNAPAVNRANTNETYIGSSRREWGRVDGSFIDDVITTYKPVKTLSNNEFTLEGQFLVTAENAKGLSGARLTQRFNASKVFMVMQPVSGAAKVRVLLDGKPVSSSVAGVDVKDGVITVDKNRLYELVNSSSMQATYTLQVVEGEVELYAVTFG